MFGYTIIVSYQTTSGKPELENRSEMHGVKAETE